MPIVSALVGAALVLFVFVESFEALVLPRRVTRPYRFTRQFYRLGWRFWTSAANLFRSTRGRHSFLSLFGPLSLLVLFAVWAASLILGYGLMHYGARPERGFGDSLYLSGETFTTLGYGDVTPVGFFGRLLAVTQAATGFGFFAVVIGYLPVLYQAFGRREAFIAMLDARAGSPPAAGRMLLRILPGSTDANALDGFLAEAERWSAEVLEGHLSFPVLGYYRCQHDNQSWLAALTCLLDACSLLLTVVEGRDRTQARLTFAMARHTLVDLGLVLRSPPTASTEDRLAPKRLDELLAKLRAGGVEVRDDEKARASLADLRRLYEPFALGLGDYFGFEVPAVWPAEERPDNWRTSAWMRQADPITALGADPKDEHFH